MTIGLNSMARDELLSATENNSNSLMVRFAQFAMKYQEHRRRRIVCKRANLNKNQSGILAFP
jgi:hypothetical protein